MRGSRLFQMSLRKTLFCPFCWYLSPIGQIRDVTCCWKGETLRVGFVLFPQCDRTLRNGTLEDLCLSILSDTSADKTLEHIDKFLADLEDYRGKPFGRIFKAKLHTYFSVHNDYVSLKIGEAAKAGAFDWNNQLSIHLKILFKRFYKSRKSGRLHIFRRPAAESVIRPQRKSGTGHSLVIE